MSERMSEHRCIDLKRPIKTVAVTAVGAGLGVVGAVAGITMAAIVFEIALPVTLCLWAGGVTFGAAGLALGIGRNKEEGKNAG